jgi:crossover junction endodeoxyribonuclease RuvC
MADRLNKVYDGISYLIDKYNPDYFAMEELFFQNNQKTAINVAMARGVILLAATRKLGSSKLYEYTPLQIKQALTGNGRAEKHQVQFMVKAILNLNAVPKPDDAADALAVAICHSQTNLVLSSTDIK